MTQTPSNTDNESKIRTNKTEENVSNSNYNNISEIDIMMCFYSINYSVNFTVM